jgi:hypothetical protein
MLPLKTLYLHIGLHKTGTTGIQTCLWNARTELLEKGYYIPRTGRPFQELAAHHNIAAQFGLTTIYNSSIGGIDNLITEICESDKKNYILSSENFSAIFMAEANITAFVKYIKPLFNEIKIVLYLRNIAVSMQSLYAQILSSSVNDIQSLFSINDQRQLAYGLFESYLNQEVSTHVPALHIDVLIENIKKISANIKIRSFELAIKKDIFTDFLEAIDFPEFESFKIDSIIVNQRHSFSEVGFTKRLLRYRLTHQVKNCNPFTARMCNFALGKPFRVLSEKENIKIRSLAYSKYKKVLKTNEENKILEQLFANQSDDDSKRKYLSRDELCELHNQLIPALKIGGTFLENLCAKTLKIDCSPEDKYNKVGFYHVEPNNDSVKIFRPDDYSNKRVQTIIKKSLRSALDIGKFVSEFHIDSPKPGDPLISQVVIEGWVRPSLIAPHLPRIIFNYKSTIRSVRPSVSRPDVQQYFELQDQHLDDLAKCGFRMELESSDIRSGVLIGLECNGIITYLVEIGGLKHTKSKS